MPVKYDKSNKRNTSQVLWEASLVDQVRRSILKETCELCQGRRKDVGREGKKQGQGKGNIRQGVQAGSESHWGAGVRGACWVFRKISLKKQIKIRSGGNVGLCSIK